MIEAIIGAGASLAGTAMTNSAASAASKKQMNFQRWMSNTAYRRAARDMEKAGLNRILALGSPASTPGGAQPTLHDMGSSAVAGAGMGASVAKTKAETSQTRNADFFNKRGIRFFKALPKLLQKTVDANNVAGRTGVDSKLLLGASVAKDLPESVKKAGAALSNPKNYGLIGKRFEEAGGWKGIYEKFRKGLDAGVNEQSIKRQMKGIDNRIFYRNGKPGYFNKAGKFVEVKNGAGPTRQRIWNQN
jgi:hypothetical protein